MNALPITRSALADRNRAMRPAFTLIEILIVIAVIVILASIAMVIGIQVTNSARERSTKATFTILDGAMSTFLKDHPEPSDPNWVAALQAFPDTSRSIASKVTSGPVVNDAWGQPIHYIPSTASAKKVGFFQSYGRDNQPGTSDDLFSSGTSAAP